MERPPRGHAGPRPSLRRRPPERLLAWLFTGPLGHLYGLLADLAVLWLRFARARLLARLR